MVTKGGSNQFTGRTNSSQRLDGCPQFLFRKIEASQAESVRRHSRRANSRKNRLFFLAITKVIESAGHYTVGLGAYTPQRAGDFSGFPAPLRDFTQGGALIPGGYISPANSIPSLFRSSMSSTYWEIHHHRSTPHEVGKYDIWTRAGGSLDFNPFEKNQFFLRYAHSTGYNREPFLGPRLGSSRVPGSR